MAVETAGTHGAARVETFEALGSTNEEALARARRGERGPLWIRALRQTSGRGRRGRLWVSEPGNLYATLLLADPCPAACAAELSFVAALAVHDAIVDTAAALGPHLRLKWPNDVLIDGAKVAGILVEGENIDNTLTVVIGGGVNCASHPIETSYPATDLAAAGAAVTTESLFSALARTMTARLAQWNRGEGFASIREDWLRRAGGLGRDIRVVIGAREAAGRFETLDERGRLVLRHTDGRTEVLAAGDVFPMLTNERHS
jgi:BirA family transcriptional regulator, biotin operon repressor / biotin---[acetyl-CoA-carboxylase] ligase